MRRRFSLRGFEMDRAKLALVVVGGVLAIEVVGYIVMASLGVAVPSEYLSFMVTTLTVLGAVAGAQYVNGKTQGS